MSSSTGKFKNRFLLASEKGFSYDCKFIVGSEKIVVEGHKFLFSVASEVFQAMFYGELKEDNAVKIKDLLPEGFIGMKHFIYTGEVNFESATHAMVIYVAARKYMIPELIQECIKYIQEEIKPYEVLIIYEFCEINSIPEFEELCLKMIEENTDVIVKSEIFPKAKIETIQLLLKSRSLTLKSEIEVFDFFERWALAEAARKKISDEELASSFKNLKKYIRFLAISPEEFTSRIKQSLLLTQAEKQAIECNLIQSDPKPMPESLSVIQQQRNFLPTKTFKHKKYYYIHSFVVSLHWFCSSCSIVNFQNGNLILYLTLGDKGIHDKYMFCMIRPINIESNPKFFMLESKVTVLSSVEGCDDLIFTNNNKIIFGSKLSEVFLAGIPLVKLNKNFFMRETYKRILVRVEFNLNEIDD
ncbi:BTB/POZ domain-containing protein 3-like [Nilaparvata lugens]|uniref:BTB/POZ domain-containing protein 3-like n=1 Tax=Nilaparvata lugens TaxID=108931 RepID=UPI00193D75F6|nr:BTB/POZ domain-containing protein 3-like [Nilaparvata lugens]